MRVAERWNAFWFAEVPLLRLGLFRIAVFTLALSDVVAYSRTALADASALSAGTLSKVWNPIYAFEVLGLQPIGIDTARVLQAVTVIVILLALLGVATRVTALSAALLAIYWTALVYSFGKVHHDKVALAFTLLALALSPCGARLSIDALVNRARGKGLPVHSPFAGLPMRVAQVTIAIGYCASGLTKLRYGGLQWMNGYTLMYYLMQYDTAGSRFLSQRIELCQALSILTVVVQTSFPLVFFWPRSLWFYLPSAVAFHLATWWAMDTGPYITLWLLLAAFLPLERIPAWVVQPWREGQLGRAAWRTAACLLPAALVIRILWYQLPLWSLAFALPALAWVARDLAATARTPAGSGSG
jgi:hypothetical protein